MQNSAFAAFRVNLGFHGRAWARHVMTRHVTPRPRHGPSSCVCAFVLSCCIASHRCPMPGEFTSCAFTIGASLRALSCLPFTPGQTLLSSHFPCSDRLSPPHPAGAPLSSNLSHPILGGRGPFCGRCREKHRPLQAMVFLRYQARRTCSSCLQKKD